ncbi:MAG: lysozyme inhibitor LprI family protein [Burkholderiaceae bacterium]
MLGGIGTAGWFHWRRKTEQTPVFENIQKAEKLLALRRDLDATTYSIDDLKKFEDALMGRSQIAKALSVSYAEEAEELRKHEFNGAMTQYDLNMAADRTYKRTNAKLQQVIEDIKQFFSPDECVRFDEVNLAWCDYQQKHAIFASSHYDGGTIKPLIYSSALDAIAIARIVSLEIDLQFMKNTQVQYKDRPAR